jgi:hypothetical protein
MGAWIALDCRYWNDYHWFKVVVEGSQFFVFSSTTTEVRTFDHMRIRIDGIDIKHLGLYMGGRFFGLRDVFHSGRNHKFLKLKTSEI